MNYLRYCEASGQKLSIMQDLYVVKCLSNVFLEGNDEVCKYTIFILGFVPIVVAVVDRPVCNNVDVNLPFQKNSMSN